MNTKAFLFFGLSLAVCNLVIAQKPFVEGTINYKVRLETTDKKEYSGIYTFTFKEGHIKKELKLSNGYQDVVLINCVKNTVYCLKTKNGKKYAIQLNMDEIVDRQRKYSGFTLKEDQSDGKTIAGLYVKRGIISFPDSSRSEIYYTTEWYPDRSVTFERYPDAHFLPLSFEYTDESGVVTHLEADKVSITPVENAIFNIPADYKMISNEEYRLLSK